MKEYFIFSVIQPNYLQHLIDLIKSMKLHKQKDVKYNYIIAIDDQNLNSYFDQLNPYYSKDFNILIFPSTIYKDKIRSPNKSYIFYIRCLIPSIFKNLDKILFIDCDTLILHEGLEQFYDTDITDFYLGACWDVADYFSLTLQDLYLTSNAETLGNHEKEQCQTNFYFNAGVMLMNLKKIREEGKSTLLEKYVYLWPFDKITPDLCDQTLLNYVLKDKVLKCSVKYNNMVSMIDRRIALRYLHEYRKWNYPKVIDSLDDTVILHYAAYPKPWYDLSQEERKKYVYFDLTKKYYDEIKKLV